MDETSENIELHSGYEAQENDIQSEQRAGSEVESGDSGESGLAEAGVDYAEIEDAVNVAVYNALCEYGSEYGFSQSVEVDSTDNQFVVVNTSLVIVIALLGAILGAICIRTLIKSFEVK